MKSIYHYCNVFQRICVKKLLEIRPIAYWLSTKHLKTYLKCFYFNWLYKWPDLDNPEDFNHWLLRTSWQNSQDTDMRKLIPQCVDKYAVREYISKMGYADTLNELIGVYDNIDEIDWGKLPNQYVLKMNNASGRNYICTNKELSKGQWKEIKVKFAEWLKDTTFGWKSGEWQYRLIKPRIVVEKFLENLGESSLIDYKFNVIYGKVYSCFVAYNRDNDDAHSRKVCFDDYDRDWNRTDAIRDSWHTDRKFIPKPQCYDRMIEMAEACCKKFPYCRFDLYEIDGKIMFGEMTFTPQGNVLEFYKDEWLKETLNVTKK